MARLSLVDEKHMSPQFAQLVEQVRGTDGYVNFLSIMAHRQEAFEPMWKSYVDMFEGGIVEPPLKELVRIKIAYLNGCLF
jgi:hypothetical protein